MTIERGSLKKTPALVGNQPTWCLRTAVRTSTQPGLRPATARIVGDLNSVLVLIVATISPPGLARSCARWRTWKASGPLSLATASAALGGAWGAVSVVCGVVAGRAAAGAVCVPEPWGSASAPQPAAPTIVSAAAAPS